MTQPLRVTDDGIEIQLSDGETVHISLAGASCEGLMDDGCIGFTDENGNHQTMTVEAVSSAGVPSEDN